MLVICLCESVGFTKYYSFPKSSYLNILPRSQMAFCQIALPQLTTHPEAETHTIKQQETSMEGQINVSGTFSEKAEVLLTIGEENIETELAAAIHPFQPGFSFYAFPEHK